MIRLAAIIAVLATAISLAGERADRALTRPGGPTVRTHLRVVDARPPGSVSGRYRGLSAEQWAARFRHRTRQLQNARADAHRTWRPTVDYALRLASAAFGVSYWELRAVASCESNLYPFARNGQYRGLFQEGPMFERHPIGAAGFNVFDPLPNALVAASTVAREGWGQWECRA